jgi:hypothetical protein
MSWRSLKTIQKIVFKQGEAKVLGDLLAVKIEQVSSKHIQLRLGSVMYDTIQVDKALAKELSEMFKEMSDSLD